MRKLITRLDFVICAPGLHAEPSSLPPPVATPEGGHRVFAKRENNATTWFRIVVGQDGTIRLRDNFGAQRPKWNRKGVSKVGNNFEAVLKKGQFLGATLPKSKSIPLVPARVAEPSSSKTPCRASVQAMASPLQIRSAAFGRDTGKGLRKLNYH